MSEIALTIRCESDELQGIAHLPERDARDLGVLIIVGGPQYRVGSHRQFVLMARDLAAAGYPTLRFDYRGMGDSSGEPRNFEAVDTDVRVALDALRERVPGLKGVILLGLCDAASATLMYCARDARVRGVVLINPWVRTEASAAQAVVRHYYGQRLLMKSFWAKVFSGQFELGTALRSFLASLRAARGASRQDGGAPSQHFIDRMHAGWRAFKGPTLCLLSDRDLTARQFEDLCKSSDDWRRCIESSYVNVTKIVNADHTFSSRAALQAAMERIRAWLETVRV